MAMLSYCNSNKSSSTHYNNPQGPSRRTSRESARRSNMQATAYAVNARDMALTGFHFSTCGAGSPRLSSRGRSGSDISADSISTAGSRRSSSSRGDAAAHHITEECERLFCETLRTVFLVEKNTGLQTSLVMDVHNQEGRTGTAIMKPTIVRHGQPTPSPSPGTNGLTTFCTPTLGPRPGVRGPATVREYIEMWDYAGGALFRGFVAEKHADQDATMFVFFDQEVIGKNLKPGLMSLLELTSSPYFDCNKLVVGVDRTADPEDVKDLTRDLGWVGFELQMLDEWAAGEEGCTSERWTFLAMDT